MQIKLYLINLISQFVRFLRHEAVVGPKGPGQATISSDKGVSSIHLGSGQNISSR